MSCPGPRRGDAGSGSVMMVAPDASASKTDEGAGDDEGGIVYEGEVAVEACCRFA